jgi:hypothetical protein
VDLGLAVPIEQRVAEQPAPREHPVVELQVVQDVAVVVDRARLEAIGAVDRARLHEHAVPVGAEVVGPRVRAAARYRPEALEVAGAKELHESPSARLRGRAGPPQLEQLVGRQEAVAPDVEDDREVARLHRDRDVRGIRSREHSRAARSSPRSIAR